MSLSVFQSTIEQTRDNTKNKIYFEVHKLNNSLYSLVLNKTFIIICRQSCQGIEITIYTLLAKLGILFNDKRCLFSFV